MLPPSKFEVSDSPQSDRDHDQKFKLKTQPPSLWAFKALNQPMHDCLSFRGFLNRQCFRAGLLVATGKASTHRWRALNLVYRMTSYSCHPVNLKLLSSTRPAQLCGDNSRDLVIAGKISCSVPWCPGRASEARLICPIRRYRLRCREI